MNVQIVRSLISSFVLLTFQLDTSFTKNERRTNGTKFVRSNFYRRSNSQKNERSPSLELTIENEELSREYIEHDYEYDIKQKDKEIDKLRKRVDKGLLSSVIYLIIVLNNDPNYNKYGYSITYCFK